MHQQQGLLQNRRLFLESEMHLGEIERLNRQLTGQSWQQYITEHDPNLFGIAFYFGGMRGRMS